MIRPSYVFLALFILLSAVHLVASWQDKRSLRAKTKPFLLSFLFLYALFASEKPDTLLLAALFACWLGDVLLIPKGNGWFTAGGIAFGIGHILFVLVYVPHIDFSLVPWQVVLPVAACYYVCSFTVIRSLSKNTPKKMLLPMYLYLLANSTMNAFAMMLMLSRPSVGGGTAYIGALLFFISDCALFLVRYHDNKHIVFKRHFTVMLTYLLGVLYIACGVGAL